MKYLLLFLFNFAFAAGTIDLNTASLKELDQITGIGPAIAQRIIDARPYSSLDDLLKVKGIGEKTLAKIKSQGMACVNCRSEAPEVLESPAPQITYPTGILINEIMPSPEGEDASGEWIEVYNSNNEAVDISGWKIRDIEGTIASYTFKITIAPLGYLVLSRTQTKILLNNEKDGLELLTPDNQVVDSLKFENAKKGESYNRMGSAWKWSNTPTPGKQNIISSSSKAKPRVSPWLSQAETSTRLSQAETKSFVQKDLTSSPRLSLGPYAIAAILAGISAFLVVYLKIILKKQKEVDKNNFLS